MGLAPGARLRLNPTMSVVIRARTLEDAGFISRVMAALPPRHEVSPARG
jgi:hypothetical protein